MRRARPIVIFAFFALLVPASLVILQSIRLLPGSPSLGSFAGAAAFIGGLASVLLLFGGLVGAGAAFCVCAIPACRKPATLIGGVLLIWWVGTFPAMKASHFIRLFAMGRAAQRGQVLIDAIEKYKADKGLYPNTLPELAPTYISQIPETGMCGYRSFEYQRIEQVFGDATGGYELKIDTSLGPLNWDVFIYWPNQQYPERTYGGHIEQIGSWAYVHE